MCIFKYIFSSWFDDDDDVDDGDDDMMVMMMLYIFRLIQLHFPAVFRPDITAMVEWA